MPIALDGIRTCTWDTRPPCCRLHHEGRARLASVETNTLDTHPVCARAHARVCVFVCVFLSVRLSVCLSFCTSVRLLSICVSDGVRVLPRWTAVALCCTSTVRARACQTNPQICQSRSLPSLFRLFDSKKKRYIDYGGANY